MPESPLPYAGSTAVHTMSDTKRLSVRHAIELISWEKWFIWLCSQIPYCSHPLIFKLLIISCAATAVTWGVAFKHHYNNGYLHWEIGAELGLIFEPCKTIQIDINPLNSAGIWTSNVILLLVSALVLLHRETVVEVVNKSGATHPMN